MSCRKLRVWPSFGDGDIVAVCDATLAILAWNALVEVCWRSGRRRGRLESPCWSVRECADCAKQEIKCADRFMLVANGLQRN